MLYIAYIETKGTKEKKHEYCFLMKGNRIAYKRKELYITYIVRKEKRVKTATNRHKKEGLKSPSNNPAKGTLIRAVNLHCSLY